MDPMAHGGIAISSAILILASRLVGDYSTACRGRDLGGQVWGKGKGWGNVGGIRGMGRGDKG